MALVAQWRHTQSAG